MVEDNQVQAQEALDVIDDIPESQAIVPEEIEGTSHGQIEAIHLTDEAHEQIDRNTGEEYLDGSQVQCVFANDSLPDLK